MGCNCQQKLKKKMLTIFDILGEILT